MLSLKIVSPEKIEYQGEVESVKMPGTLGNFEVLDNHAPIISSLQRGVVEYIDKEGRHELPVTGGFAEVLKNQVSLCVEKDANE